MVKSKVDKRNKLNDLDGKNWIKSTKSYWISEKCVDDKIALKHPAPFMVKDIIKLVSFFTKKKQLVLDPFKRLKGCYYQLFKSLRVTRNANKIRRNCETVKL